MELLWDQEIKKKMTKFIGFKQNSELATIKKDREGVKERVESVMKKEDKRENNTIHFLQHFFQKHPNLISLFKTETYLLYFSLYPPPFSMRPSPFFYVSEPSTKLFHRLKLTTPSSSQIKQREKLAIKTSLFDFSLLNLYFSHFDEYYTTI